MRKIVLEKEDARERLVVESKEGETQLKVKKVKVEGER